MYLSSASSMCCEMSIGGLLGSASPGWAFAATAVVEDPAPVAVALGCPGALSLSGWGWLENLGGRATPCSGTTLLLGVAPPLPLYCRRMASARARKAARGSPSPVAPGCAAAGAPGPVVV